MSRSSLFSLQQFHQLILNASTYMNKIEAFSFKMANSDMEAILSCLSSAEQILTDANCPILKKLFVLRFVKDTLILASLPFYIAVLVQVVPWLLQVAKISESKQPEARLWLMGKLLKGDKFQPVQDSKICSTILQLVEEMVKWFGTNIRNHPYSKLQFRSAFRVVLDRLPRVQNFKISQLTFFKADDPNKYQAYYIERESGESEWERIVDYILQVLQGVEEGQEGQEGDRLQALVQTGDGHVIAAMVEELQGSLEVASPSNIHMKMNLIYLMNRLVAVGEVELVNQIKNVLLEKVIVIAQIIHKHKEEFEDSSKLISDLIGMMQNWRNKCQSVLLPAQVFRQAFKILQGSGVRVQGISPQLQPRSKLGLAHEISKDKLNQLNCDEADSIRRIRVCQYIPIYQSQPIRKGANLHKRQNNDFISNNRSESRHSHSSSSLNNGRKEFLQAFSKYPQQMNQLRGNTSELKEIYLQHSNISQKNRMKEGETPLRPLIMSFKKPQPIADRLSMSPQVVFSDSFTSNHKNSPFKIINSQQFINMVNPPSMDMHSEPSYEQQRVVLPQNTVSKNNLSSKKQSGVSKSLKNSQKSHEENIALIKDVKDSIKYNDYMLPEKQGNSHQPSHRFQFSKQSSVASKELSKPKKQKSSSLARPNKGSLLKSASKSKMLSPASRMGHHTNLIHFGQLDNERENQGREVAIAKTAVEAIQVEKTVAKPKFSFKVSEESILTDNQTVSYEFQTQNTSHSLPIGSSKFDSPSNSNSLSQVPDNFMDLLRVKTDRVKVNAFQDKAKELETQIQKVRSKKLILAQELNEKNMMLEKLRFQMPQPKEQLQQENKRLRNAIKAKQVGNNEAEYFYSYSQAVKGVMKHISVSPLREDSKKLLLYSKCRLYKGESLEIGFQAKEGYFTFYLTFLKYVEDCSIRLETNSLKVEEEIDAKMYKLAEGKQIKFKSKLKDYQLFQGEFRLASLIVKSKQLTKQTETIQTQVPFHLYNLYRFHPPSSSTVYRKSSDWHFSCDDVLTNPHYITDYFPHSRPQLSTFSIRAQLDQFLTSCRIILDANKFLIEYEGLNQDYELMLVRCVMAIIERSS